MSALGDIVNQLQSLLNYYAGQPQTVANANQVQITSTGSTTARALADRFSSYANALDYGAVGDGVTDDTAAILVAVGTGKHVLFPGQHVVKASIATATNQKLYGLHRSTSKLLKSFNGDLLTLASGSTLDSLTLDGQGSAGWTGKGVVCNGSTFKQSGHHLSIVNFNDHALHFTWQGGSNSTWDDCEFAQYNAATNSGKFAVGVQRGFPGADYAGGTGTARAGSSATIVNVAIGDTTNGSGFYNGTLLSFTSGALAGQFGVVQTSTNSGGGNWVFTFLTSTFSGAPSASDALTVSVPGQGLVTSGSTATSINANTGDMTNVSHYYDGQTLRFGINGTLSGQRATIVSSTNSGGGVWNFTFAGGSFTGAPSTGDICAMTQELAVPRLFTKCFMEGTPSFDFGASNATIVVGSYIDDCRYEDSVNNVHLSGTRLGNMTYLPIYGRYSSIMGGSIAPQSILGKDCIGWAVGPFGGTGGQPTGGLGVVDCSQNSMNNTGFGIQFYTPTWTQAGGSPAIGNGTLQGTYQRTGGMMHVTVRLLAGSTTAFGVNTSGWTFSLPMPISRQNNQVALGLVWATANGSYAPGGVATAGPGDQSFTISHTNGSLYRSDTPSVWTNADEIRVNISYPI